MPGSIAAADAAIVLVAFVSVSVAAVVVIDTVYKDHICSLDHCNSTHSFAHRQRLPLEPLTETVSSIDQWTE